MKKIIKPVITLLLLLLIGTAKLIAQPTITSFLPGSGPVGSVVTITGTGFSANIPENIVSFGTARATVTAATTTALTVTVPSGASFHPITVTTNRLTAYAAVAFIVTFSGGGRLNRESFRVDVSVDDVSNSLIETSDPELTDFDGDGRPDVAVLDGRNNQISVYKNTSADSMASFAARQNFETPVSPNNITTGDLDGDGRPELVVSSSQAELISVFKNISTPGSIAFAQRADFATRSAGSDVGIRDFDGDGRPDIAVLGLDLDSINASGRSLSYKKQ